VKISEKFISEISRKLNLHISVKFNLTRDMTDIELKFLQRWIDLDDLYRLPLPLRKILVPPGTEGPPTQF